MNAPASTTAVVSVEQKGSGFVGVARRSRELIATCGCRGHLHETEARACMVAMAQAIGLRIKA